jgi:hypothetical protein
VAQFFAQMKPLAAPESVCLLREIYTVDGPDDHVFYGVLEAQFPSHNARGWLLQFDASLNPAGVPGSFGWDVSPSVIPASMVPSYTGASSYLLALKYNNDEGAGTGDGLNKLAVLDPQASQADPIVPSVQAMREVLTILGPTLDAGSATARREWCINTMAADPMTKSILANNEDGALPLGPDGERAVAKGAAHLRPRPGLYADAGRRRRRGLRDQRRDAVRGPRQLGFRNPQPRLGGER